MSLFDDASLVLTPNGVKSGKVYSIKPTDGVGDFDFTRASSATRVNSDGLIETVSTGVPRLDYPPLGGCPSLLLEPQRTNQLAQSEYIGAYFFYANASASNNQAISPEGIVNAASIIPDATNGIHQISSSNISASGSFTLSAFVKAGELNKVAIRESNATGAYASFDLSTGTKIEDNVSGDAFIEPFANDWYRIGVTYTHSGNIRLGINLLDNSYTTGNPSSGATYWSSNGTDKLFVYGLQCELGASYATSYIPTSGSTVTRVAEVCNGAGNAATFNDSEGVLMAEISALADGGSTRVISLSGGSQSVNNIYINLNSSGGVAAQVLTSGGSNNLSTLNINQTDINKIVVKYKANDFSLWLNGFEVDTDTTLSSTPTGLDRLNFDFGAGSFDFYGNTKQLQYFDKALTDAELEYLTSYRSFNEMATSQLYTIE